MKKIFKILILFFVFLGVFLTGISPAFCENLWSDLSQKDRKEYINSCLEKMESIKIPSISKSLLEDKFGLSTNRDPNYKLHSQGLTQIDGAISTKTFTSYQPQGFYLTGSQSKRFDVQVGYVLKKDDYKLEFNKSGSLQYVIVKSEKTSEGIYFEKIYSKNLNLKSVVYYDYPYQVIFDGNLDVEKILEYNQAYNIRGKKI